MDGAELGHFSLLEKIGEGGMGRVYKARDMRLERMVAIKILPESRNADPGRRARFVKEAQAASALNHPNIITIHEIGEQEGQTFIVMELVDGKPLNELIPRKGMRLTEALRIAAQVASALAAAHAAGIMHRDLKPANIMVDQHGRVKVLDFGLAKLSAPAAVAAVGEDQSTQSMAMDQPLTEEGIILGSVPYMSPEQADSKPVDARSDIFSFGAVLYEMITGQRAFRGESRVSTLAAILGKDPQPASEISPTTPPELERLIVRCLRKDVNRRSQHMSDVNLALEELREESESGIPQGVTTAAPKRRRLWILGAGIIVAVVGAVYFFLHRPVPELTERDTIVLADFTNATGDSVFDGTLRQGLSVQLEQSPFLNLLSDRRIAQTLVLMAQPKDARLTQELTREVCERTASAATIEGSISSLGSQYVLGLKAVNCRNGDLLTQMQVTANGKEQVLKALGGAAAKLREKMGESLASVQKYDAPPENVTTRSLEALQAYSLGYQAQLVKSDSAAAISFYQRAISLDSNFATAYARLGASYYNLNETVRAAENTRKAYELRERTSERERLYTSAQYEEFVIGNLEAARTAYELWVQTYPRDGTARFELSAIYISLGEYDRALKAAQEALKLEPESDVSYGNLVLAYQLLNRLDEAKATAQDAQAHNLAGSWVHFNLYGVDFLQHDAAGMEREAVDLMGEPGYQDVMLYLESDTAAYAGQFVKARELTRRASETAQRTDKKERAAEYKAEAAVREALVGNMALAKQVAQAALALTDARDVEGISAVALGLAGDSAQAGLLAGDLGRRLPEDTVVRFHYLPMIHAAVGLRGGYADKAVKALASAAPYDLGQFQVTGSIALYPVYLRGEAYLGTKQGAAAGAEFQKILDHSGAIANEPIGALAHVGLGRAYGLAGDSARAKTAYQDFLALWKAADSDIPLLKQAKAEYAKLK
jgi:eukaryotic-like serine/threonine-protein kinase